MSPEVESLLAEQPWVQRLARALVRDSSLADDFAQEAMLAALRRGSGAQDGEPGALRAFLAGVLRNLRRSRERAEAGRARREALAAEPEALPSPEDLLERAELHRLLVDTVLALGEEERTAILLRYFEGLSAEEIARRSGEPAATIRSRIHRGLARLRGRLERRLPRRDLLAGLVSLTWGRSNATAAAGASAAAGPALPVLGGIVLMKTIVALAAACLALATLAAGIWLADWKQGETRERIAPPGGPAIVATAGTVSEGVPAGEPEAETAARSPVAPVVTEETPLPAGPAETALSRAPRLDGRIVDERRFGVPGAAILEGGKELGESGPSGAVDVALAAVEKETATTLEFHHPRFARKRVTVRVAPAAEIHLGELALVPAGEIRGWVEDALGHRVAGAQVIVAGLENPRTDPEELRRHGPLEDESTLAVESGPDGGFALGGVPAGTTRVWAGAGGFAWSPLGPLEVVAGETVGDLRFVLAELRSDDRIAGFVLDPEENPVAGAKVHYWFTAATYGTGAVEETDAEGRFEILLRQRVVHDLTVSDRENRWSEVYLFGVEPGTTDLELRFEPERWMDVAVSDRDGHSIDGFELALESSVDWQWLQMKSRTELQDAGRIRARVPNERFRVAATARGYERAVQGPFEPGNPPASLSFALAKLPGVHGRVLGADGGGVAGAKVGLRRTMGGQMAMIEDGFRVLVDPYRDNETTTDGDGRFTLYPDAAAEHVIEAEAPGYALTVLGPRPLDPQEALELEIQLVKGGAIEGQALAPGGLAPTGFVIAYHRGDGNLQTVRLGEDGRYRLEGLTPGPWEVRPLGRELEPQRSTTSSTYYPDGGAPPMEDWTCEVLDGETTRYDVDLSGFAPCEIAGALALEGRQMESWTASLERRSGVNSVDVVASTPLAADGTFELVAPQAGEYTLVLRGPEEPHGRLELTETLRLSPGSVAWQLALRPGRIEGSGALGKGTRERFYTFKWSSSRDGHALAAAVRIVPDAGGRFVLATVPDGPGTITRNDPPAEGQRFGEWETVAEFEVPPGGVQRVALR